MITKDEINLGAQYFAPGQLWWFDLSPYGYKNDVNAHSSARPYLVIASVGRRIYVTPVTHSDVNGSNFRFSIPTIRSDRVDGSPDISYVCMDNIQQIRVDSYVADGGTYSYAGCLTPAVMQKLMAGFIASLLFNNYGIDYISDASQMAVDMLEAHDEYTVTGFTPCVVHGDAELMLDAEDDSIVYKKDYRMIGAINAHANRVYAATKKPAVTETAVVHVNEPSTPTIDAGVHPESSVVTVEEGTTESQKSVDNSSDTTTTAASPKKSYVKYDAVSIERGTLKFASEELAEQFAKSLIEPDKDGAIDLISFQREFTRVTGSFINRESAMLILKDTAMNRSMDNGTVLYGCAYKRDILKRLMRKCPMDKFNKKQALLDEIRSDIENYGSEVTGYKWGYSPKYLPALLG